MIDSGYTRVLPRDLYNEASLLKMIARLFILLGETRDHKATIGPDQLDNFVVEQDPSDGSIAIANVHFQVGGVRHILCRPLNARGSWPLYVMGTDLDPDFDEISVFDDNGDFTPEMLTLIGVDAS